MDRHYQHRHSHLFTVRMWQEELGEGQSEWRGKVQHVQSGEVFYFRQWTALVATLEKMLAEFEAGSQPGQRDIDEITR